VLAAIAAENNLSETAFVVARQDPVPLRWFTPAVEVDLCGHATLATAHVLFRHLSPGRERIAFSTRSGTLTVTREGELLSMDFPARARERGRESPTSSSRRWAAGRRKRTGRATSWQCSARNPTCGTSSPTTSA
jgi:PhzF family phenazine biosynthesis protein